MSVETGKDVVIMLANSERGKRDRRADEVKCQLITCNGSVVAAHFDLGEALDKSASFNVKLVIRKW
jgi:hypothetical protein